MTVPQEQLDTPASHEPIVLSERRAMSILSVVGVAGALVGFTLASWVNAESSTQQATTTAPATSEPACEWAPELGVCMSEYYEERNLILELNNARFERSLPQYAMTPNDDLSSLAGLLFNMESTTDELVFNQPYDLSDNIEGALADPGYAEYYADFGDIAVVSAAFDKTQGVTEIPLFDLLRGWQEGPLEAVLANPELTEYGLHIVETSDYKLVAAVFASHQTSVPEQ